ncbi:hypothetical protein BGZ98_006080 [Dissophora globulifera]|nr:hypothetical protein BGZ98_006080 [Dissophora globulifera]
MRRDTMAGHNIASIVRSQVEKIQRPLYLHPVDKDGKYPWLERGGKGGSQPKDCSGPSQQGSGSGSSKRKTKDDDDADKKQNSKRTKGITACGSGGRGIRKRQIDVDDEAKHNITKGTKPTVVARQDSSITKDDVAIMVKLRQTAVKGKAAVDRHMQVGS